MTEDYNIDNDRANARIDFMSHVGIIAQKSITDDQSAIVAQGDTFQERLHWLKTLEKEFDAIGVGLDWSTLDSDEYHRPSRHNAPSAFLDTLLINPTKADNILEIINAYFNPIQRFMSDDDSTRFDSYLLKHLVEANLNLVKHYTDPTFGNINNNYVSNGDVKGAMLLLGFKIPFDDLKQINWSFNTSVNDWLNMQNDIAYLRSNI